MKDKVILITGCSSGFGYQLAEQALEAGAKVAATSRDTSKLESLVSRFPNDIQPLELDLTSSKQIAEVVDLTEQAFGKIDVLINNAGYGLIAALEETSEEQIQRITQINYLGPLMLTRRVLPIFRKQGSGQIITISAVAGLKNHEGFSVYGGAKFALEGAFEALQCELKPLGIQVNLVEPGPFRTDFIERNLESPAETIEDYKGTSGAFAKMLTRINGKQPGDPAKAAKLMLKLVESARANAIQTRSRRIRSQSR